MRQRPNILCLVSEDCPPRLGAYRDTVAQTPILDALARQGVTYDAACCTSPVCAPSRFAILTGRHAESCPPAQHMTSFGPTPPGIVTVPELLRGVGYYCTNNAKTHYNCDIDPHAIWNETSNSAHWLNRPEGAPFYAVFNPMLTHESCMFAPQEGAVGPADVRVPAYLPDTEGVRQSLASYYNRIAAMDAAMGARLAELDAAGLSDDTIIIYHSDHGAPLPRSKRFCYDDGLRVPLIVRVPERWRHLLPHAPGSRVADPVSLVDLLPSLAAIAGVPVPDGVHGRPFLGPDRRARSYAFSGRDRMDEHYDMTRSVRGRHHRYIRNYAPHRIWGQHYAFAWLGRAYQDYETMHSTGQLTPVQARFWQTKPAEELYDMRADPDSVRNLAESPAHAGVLAEMRAALDSHMLAIRDCGFIPEGSLAEGWDASRNNTLFPLEEVLDLAARAIRRDPAEAMGFMQTLRHDSTVIRFWAAQGLLMLAVAGHPLPNGVGFARDTEKDLHVVIPLTEALGQRGDAEDAVRRLTDIARTAANDRLRLQALESLHYLPMYPEISLPLVAALSDDLEEYIRGAAGYLKLRLEGTYGPQARVFRFDLFRPSGHSGLESPSVATPPQTPQG